MENPRSLSRDFWVFSAAQKGKCQKPKREKSLYALFKYQDKDK
jgi:hypothetical protein